MKGAVAVIVLACSIAFRAAAAAAAAAEPSIVLVTPDETRIYQTGNGQIALKERRANGADFDDTQNAQPLQYTPGSEHLVKAYIENLLDCGLNSSSSASLEEWIKQESAATDGRWLRRLVTRSVNDSYILISAQGGQRALVIDRNTGQRLPGSPCGAAVKFARISPDEQRVAFIAEGLKAIEFYGSKGHVSWSSRRSGTWFVQIHQLRAKANFVSTSKVENEPIDLMLPNEGVWWLLVATYSGEWWKPSEWIYSVGGHGTRLSNISLLTYSSSGEMSSRHVVSGVELVSGHLIWDVQRNGDREH